VQKKYDIVQLDGLAGVGERVDPGDVYINKQTPTNANDNAFTGQAAAVPYKNSPLTYKSPVAGNIDKVLITDTENDQTLIKVLIRQTRRPELGDKFSSRHGQKGVCGLIVNQEDMPFNDQGVVPGASADAQETLRFPTRFPRFYHESARLSVADDSGEDDRTSCWQGAASSSVLSSRVDIVYRLVYCPESSSTALRSVAPKCVYARDHNRSTDSRISRLKTCRAS
jgi:hypothetical protein